MKIENLKLSEVIKLIEDKPDEILKIKSLNFYQEWTGVSSFTINVYWWTSRNYKWAVELKPIKKELTRVDLAEAWDIEGVTVKNAKLASESKFFKAICERLGL